MTATDTFTSQEAVELEHSEYLLRLLAHGYYVGIAETDVGVNCVYCDWHHENEEREHEGCTACALINHVELELGRG